MGRLRTGLNQPNQNLIFLSESMTSVTQDLGQTKDSLTLNRIISSQHPNASILYPVKSNLFVKPRHRFGHFHSLFGLENHEFPFRSLIACERGWYQIEETIDRGSWKTFLRYYWLAIDRLGEMCMVWCGVGDLSKCPRCICTVCVCVFDGV